ncbi:MAG: leucyl/phenylalanyl-tRNA--protein transferase [Dehalococcoidia bacterium]
MRAPVPLPASPYVFPDPREAGAEGLVAMGADLSPSTIVAAYRQGMFPWPHGGDDLLWWSPDPRGVLFPERIRVTRRLARTIRQGRFRITLDAAFEQVIHSCSRRDEGTWITPGITEAYVRLHQLGWAHSFEAWDDGGRLAGGLYGLHVGGMFGAESMFHRARDASKVAMVAMAQHCARVGIAFVDVQLVTPHLARMGCEEVPREAYLDMLGRVVDRAVRFGVS